MWVKRDRPASGKGGDRGQGLASLWTWTCRDGALLVIHLSHARSRDVMSHYHRNVSRGIAHPDPLPPPRRPHARRLRLNTSPPYRDTVAPDPNRPSRDGCTGLLLLRGALPIRLPGWLAIWRGGGRSGPERSCTLRMGQHCRAWRGPTGIPRQKRGDW
jgi:hypothetical protein